MASRTAKIGVRLLIVSSFLFVGQMVSAQARDGVVEAGSAEETREWRFRVYLDGKDIGHHTFRVLDKEREQRVEIDASFDVKFLFFNAFSYRHNNVEQWRGDCLEDINSTTQAGRKEFRVSGSAGSGDFEVETLAESYALNSDCVRTFAYWNPRLLNTPRLLNAQTGEWIEVRPGRSEEELLEVLGRQIPARRYDLELPDGTISLWYDEAENWLSLEAPAPGGRVLRYIPEQVPVEILLDDRIAIR